VLTVIKALSTGAFCGFVFAAVRLPIPAPTVFAGVAGIIGIWLGYLLFTNVWG
jgi:XapX domain-containing protein